MKTNNNVYVLIAAYTMSTIIGIDVALKSYAVEGNDRITDKYFSDYIDKYMRLFGFNDYDNYDNSYPGHHPGHKHRENPIINERFKQLTHNQHWIDFPIKPVVCHQFVDLTRDANSWDFNIRKSVDFMQIPTVDTVRLIDDFKNNGSTNLNLWFCSDWKETEDKPK